MPNTALPNVTVAQLSYLVAAAEAETWKEASQRVGVSQSGFSQGLSELERRLGIALFERVGRTKALTSAARPVVDHARRVLAQTSELATWLDEVRSGRGGRVRVGMIDAAAIDHYGDTLRQHRDDNPDLDLRLRVGPSSEMLRALRSDELDLAVCVRPSDDDDLDVHPLMKERLLAYPPVGVDRSAPWGPWVTFPEGSLTRELIASALRTAGRPFDVVAESHQPEVLKEMVHLGLGWTYLPEAQARREPRPLRAHRAAPEVTRELVAVRRSSGIPQPAVDALLTHLRDT